MGTKEPLASSEDPWLAAGDEPLLVETEPARPASAAPAPAVAPVSGGAAPASGRIAPATGRATPASGVRQAPTALLAKLETIAAASARTGAMLSDLLRTAKFLTASIQASMQAVSEANETLAREIEGLSQLLEGGSDRSALERRIRRLEHIAEQTAQEAVRDRERLMAEHDAFIAMLMGDHDRELETLRRKLAEAGPASPIESAARS